MAQVLNPGQAKFAATLSQLTGLDPHVVGAWTLAEESGSAAQKRAAAGNNNWLNIGMFDSGPSGKITHDKTFSDPVSAAKATAQFLKGQKWGASKGIQGILGMAGKDPASQINAIAKSGWASSGYRNGDSLRGTYSLVSGLKLPSGKTAQTTLPGGQQTTPAGASATSSPAATPGSPVLGLTPGGLLEAAKAHLGQTKAASGISFIEQALGQSKDPAQQTQMIGMLKLPSGAFAQTQVNKLKMSPDVEDPKLSPSGQGIVQAALKFKGTPYSWGGGGVKGPTLGIAQGAKTKGFDCSGLVQYSVAAATGKVIPRVASAQYAASKKVPLGAAKPGDIVAFGSKDNIHHIGIYLGDGKFIEAPHTGDVVKVSSLAGRKDLVGVGRF